MHLLVCELVYSVCVVVEVKVERQSDDDDDLFQPAAKPQQVCAQTLARLLPNANTLRLLASLLPTRRVLFVAWVH